MLTRIIPICHFILGLIICTWRSFINTGLVACTRMFVKVRTKYHKKDVSCSREILFIKHVSHEDKLMQISKSFEILKQVSNYMETY